MNLELKVKDLIKKDLEDSGFKLISVKYEKEDKNYFLRIVIDREEIVTMDDCLEATKIIDKLLDEADPIDREYILDVSSNERGGK
ncbi:MAG: hypothetical protein PHS45_02940 [Bacilli bacterium]|nr:hypothetical protein [Bacilli bacterium]